MKRILPWLIWAAIFFPAMAIINMAIAARGFGTVFPLLLVILVVTLLCARYVGGRSWRSIMWGDRD